MAHRIYRVRGLNLEARDVFRASLLARSSIATVGCKQLDSDTYEYTVGVSDGTGWVPGIEGLCRSLGGEVLPDPRGA